MLGPSQIQPAPACDPTPAGAARHALACILATRFPGAQGPRAARCGRRVSPAVPAGLALLVLLGGVGGASGASPGTAAWRELLRHHLPEAAEQARAALREGPDPIAAYVLARSADVTGTAAGAESLLVAISGTPDGAGAAAIGLAQLRLAGGEPDSAATLLAAARAKLAAAGNRQGEVFALGLLAWVHMGQGNVELAIPLLEEALATVPEAGSPELVAWLHLRLGLALFSSRRYGEATQHYESAVALAHELDIPEWEAEGHINLSVVARWRMELDDAMAHRRAALEGYRSSGNVAGQARALHYIAAVHMIRGELPQATRLLREAIEAAGRAGESREAATSQGDLATLNYLLGNYELALEQYDQALRTYESAVQAEGADRQHDAWAAGMLTNIASVLIDMGRLREAGDYGSQALAAVRRTGNHRDEAGILDNVGRCLCLSGDAQGGRAALEAAIDSARTWSVPLTEATALADLGACHLLGGDLMAADSAYAAAEALASRTGYFRLQGDVLAGRARVARLRGDPAAALALLERAMGLAEGVRARSRGAEQIQARAHGRSEGIYTDAVDLIYTMSLAQPALAARAFDFVQRAKARSLLDLLAEADIGLRCRADPRYVRREQAILDSIAEILNASAAVTGARVAPADEADIAIAQLEDELSALESELRDADPRYAAVQYPQPESLEHLQAAVLEPGELLLEYLLGEDASYLCAVTRDSYRLVQLPARERIEAEVETLLPLLRDYNLSGGAPAYLAEPLAALSESVLGPVREECQRAKRLIVAPHGALYYVPFEVLFGREFGPTGGSRGSQGTRASGFAGLPYLVRSTDIVYVHAAGTLAHRREGEESPSGPPTRLLVVGNPPGVDGASSPTRAFFGAGLLPGTGAAERDGAGAETALPGAEAEITMIRDVFPRSEIVVLEGRDATEEGLRQATAHGPYDLVHVAAHGLFNERRPRYSGLVLAPAADGNADGFLTVGEVFGIELPCRQIVLSACSSALGENLTGEGLYGLTRAFQYAGARCVIAAFWDVDDVATAAFMREFYEELARQGGTGGAHALATAKRRWLAEATGAPGSGQPASAAPIDKGHPCFWAAFVASGEGR
jgi:CHAT domain-containing protein